MPWKRQDFADILKNPNRIYLVAEEQGEILGGCMLTEREVLARMEQATKQGTPVTNYGTAIAQMNGILKRALSIFPDLAAKI